MKENNKNYDFLSVVIVKDTFRKQAGMEKEDMHYKCRFNIVIIESIVYLLHNLAIDN